MTKFDDMLASQPDANIAAVLRESGIYAAIYRIKAMVESFDEGMRDAAATAVPDGPTSMDSLLANLCAVPYLTVRARPELVTDRALASILVALQSIDAELSSYLADGDVRHLTAVLGTEMQNFQRELRHCYGFWRLPRDPSQPVRIRRLRLQLALPATKGHPEAQAAVQILVDGVELLAQVDGLSYVGFPAGTMLGPDAPLLPADPARYVPLYRETGGGSGCIAAVIHTYGDNVAWNAFRRFESMLTSSMQPVDGTPFGRPRVFNGAQYRAEVQRAKTQGGTVARP
jgi:hypothetical protein